MRTNHRGMQMGLYVDGYVYLAYSPRLDIYKIGRTINLEKRLHGLKHFSADGNIQYIHAIRSQSTDILESKIHQVFADKEIQVFSEWYRLDQEDIEFFKSS